MNSIKIGQLWLELDNRSIRDVEVVDICEETGKILIQKVDSNTGNKYGKITRAKKGRFNGKSGGYLLIEPF